MISLRKIESFIQHVAQAISTVIDIEVTIVDEQLIRIVGTGKCIQSVGQRLDEGSLAWRVFQSKNYLIVRNAVESPLCQNCAYVETCTECAEALYPILYENNVIGVIGLIAYTEKQKENLLERLDSLGVFIERMAQLICSKLSELNKSNALTGLNNELEKIINAVDEGIIVTDKRFQIQYVNEKIKGFFRYQNNKSLHLSDVFINDNFLQELNIYPLVENYLYQQGDESFLITSHEIATAHIDNHSSYMFVVKKVSDIQKSEYSARVNIVEKGHKAKWHFKDMIVKSPSMLSLIEEAQHYAKTNSTIIIQGESGAGKEILAQCIHNGSKRKHHPFVAINCAAIPAELLESILFGYAPGAFTGANKNGKIGLFELAHTGTIFLDEIGEMSLSLQSHLLRVIEEKEILRVGGDKVIPTDVRIIAATHKDLYSGIQKNQFREDLYYRLNVLNLALPSLKERKEEIPELCKSFINDFAKDHHIEPFTLTNDLLLPLINYAWPGNIRELRNITERLLIKSQYSKLSPELIHDVLHKRYGKQNPNNFNIQLSGDFKDIETQLIKQVVETTTDMDEVARKLGLSKTTIWRRLKEANTAQ